MDNESTWKFIDMYFRDNPRFKVKHHLDSYNSFIRKGISQILHEKNPIRFFKEPGKYKVVIDDKLYSNILICNVFINNVLCIYIIFGSTFHSNNPK